MFGSSSAIGLKKAATGNSGANLAKDRPAERAASKPAAERPAAAAATPAVKIESLAGMATEDLMASLPPTEALPPLAVGSSGAQRTLSRTKQSAGAAGVLGSPWLWVGLGGLVVVVALTLVILLIGGPSKDQSGSAATTTAPHPQPPAPPTPPPVAPNAPKPIEPPKPIELPKPVEPVKPPIESPRPVEPAKPVEPAAKPIEPPKPVEPPKPAEPKPKPVEKPVDADALLAGVKAMSFQLNSFDNNPASRFNLALQRQAATAAKQLGIAIDEKATTVMELQIGADAAASGGGMYSIMMAGKLQYPGEDGKSSVTIWTHTRHIATLEQQKLGTNPALAVLKAGVGKFFEQFVEDVRQARAKAGEK